MDNMKKILRKSICFLAIKTSCLIVIMFFTGISCDKADKPNNEEVLNINAKVENAIEYSNVVAVKLMMRDKSGNDIELARSDWNDNGFAISLPKINRDNYSELITLPFLPVVIYENLVTITTNNKNARNRIAEFWGVDKEGNKVTEFFPHKIDEDSNEVRVQFIYVNSDVIISGYIEAGTVIIDYFDEETLFTSNWIWENHTIYLIEYKEGWNASSHSIFQSSDGKIVSKLSTIPTGSNFKWYGSNSYK